ncbi:MAG: leucine-rich repeat domain-containing protein [Clostridia bacterium]|nr:leucine-rich repeat domain-containing protein [Clostridia bacterium]
MNLFKKSISIFLCILLLALTLFAESAYALDSNGVTYDIEDGSLIVGGSGEMLNTYENDLTLTEVYILNGVTSVPDNAFSGCSNLERVVMYNSVTFLGKNAFKGCSSLSQIKLSRSINAIGESTFEGCSSLKDIKLPESAVSVGKNAFKDCTSLEFAIITMNVKTIEDGAFANCTALTDAYYAGYRADYENVEKPNNLFGTAKISYISPIMTVRKTYASKVATARVTYIMGNFGSMDGQFILTGDAKVVRVGFLRNTTYSSNSKEGRFAIMDTNKVATGGADVVTWTYSFENCKDFSVKLIINSCTVMIGSYDVQVPVSVNNTVFNFEHQYSETEIDNAPSAEADGMTHRTCTTCGYTENTEMPFIFKNCEMSDSTAVIPEYQLSENDFRANYLKYDFPVVTGAYGEFIGTGSTVKAKYDNGITYDYDVAVVGDTDKDGLCDARDAVIIMCINEGLLDADALENCVKIAADADRNKVIDENDSLLAIAKGVALQ